MASCENCGQSVRRDSKTGICSRESCRQAQRDAYYTLTINKQHERQGRYRSKNSYRVQERRYGLADGQYLEILETQGGCCLICGCTPEENGRNLAVDHDHSCCHGPSSCGKCIRGLLCHRCNRVLGMLNDDVDLLASMMQYLEES